MHACRSTLEDPTGDPRFDPALAHPDDPAHEVLETRSYTECFWLDRDYYVQTISDADATVIAFSVTTRSRRFRPAFELPRGMGWRERRRWKRRNDESYRPVLRVRLGHTRFSDLGNEVTDTFAGPRLRASLGARTYSYTELKYLANPGHYQTAGYTSSIAAPQAPHGDFRQLVDELGAVEWPNDDDDRDWDDLAATKRFRRRTVITTFTLLGPNLWPENYPSTYGPHGDEVRTLP